jgi:hypothetical protein
MNRYSLLVLSFVLVISSCRFLGGERVSGDGNITTENRQVGNFNSVELSGSLNVHLKQEPTNAVRVEADANLMPYIEVYTDGNTLVIREKRGYNLNPTKEIIVYATAPVYRHISISGSGSIFTDNELSSNELLDLSVSGSGGAMAQLNTAKLNIKVSGSGSVTVKGQASEMALSISGSGSVNAFDLNSENVTVGVSGSGDAQVNANTKLDVRASGSGSVSYKGNATVNKSTSGSGDVNKVN